MKQHNIDESFRNANNRNPQRYHGRHSLIYFLCIACLFFYFLAPIIPRRGHERCFHMTCKCRLDRYEVPTYGARFQMGGGFFDV